MRCTSCKNGTMQEGKTAYVEKSTTTYMSEYDGCYIIIKNVPCNKCTQCGEEYLNGVTLQNIEKILGKVKNALTEFAVIDYNKAA